MESDDRDSGGLSRRSGMILDAADAPNPIMHLTTDEIHLQLQAE
jgi:hypothetical protein